MNQSPFLQQIITSLLIILGSMSLQAQTNVTLGPDAGTSITTGDRNTFLGEESGSSMTTSTLATFVGYRAGRLSISGGNTFLGAHAGENNTSGFHNTFVGLHAGRDNTIGKNNTFIGRSSGAWNTTGRWNTFVGELSGSQNETGRENTFIGYHSGGKNSEGESNTFVGFKAGRLNTLGDNNTFFGKEAGFKNSIGFNNTLGGYKAGYENTSGYYNAAWGFSAGLLNTTGDKNTFIGTFAGYQNTTGNKNTYLGQQANGMYANNNSTAIGAHAYVFGSNRLVLGSTAGYNGTNINTMVGIANVTPGYILHLGLNSAAKPGSNVWNVASDRRLKQDIAPFTDGISVIQKIKPVRYQYNGKANMPTGEEFVGIIAQDMQRVAPYMVGEFTYQDTTGKEEVFLDFDGNALTYMLINSVKELNNSLEDLYTHHEELMMEMAELKSKYDSLAHISAPIGSARPRNSSRVFPSQAKIWQNSPNPSHGFTNIKYHIPEQVSKSYVRILTMDGKRIKDYRIEERGYGILKLHTSSLAAGTYIYQLIADNEIMDSKRMILSR